VLGAGRFGVTNSDLQQMLNWASKIRCGSALMLLSDDDVDDDDDDGISVVLGLDPVTLMTTLNPDYRPIVL
jgi:hypothetical protein